MVTPPPQQFCVRWNSYQSNLQNAFPKLLTSEHFVDVTLACENEMLKCHKVVLSACSTYFEKLLLDNPCQHPIIFMKDMRFSEMQSLVDFMYKGEVNVTQDDLPSLLKSAEALQIRGLCGSDQLLNPSYFGNIKNMNQTQQPVQPQQTQPKLESPNGNVDNKPQPSQVPTNKANEQPVKKETNNTAEGSDSGNNPSSSECDSNDGMLQIKVSPGRHGINSLNYDHHGGGSSNYDHHGCGSLNYYRHGCGPVSQDIEDEPDDNFFDGDGELMDQELTEEDGTINTDIKPQFSAIANVSCQYDGTPGSANRRIRRSDEELRRAAECITRGQTFQTVSDQFNIPISTIRFYMARKGILPRRKRGRACAGPMGMGMGGMPIGASYNSPASPIGPPYHIVHYKLPALGVSKLK